MIKVNYEEFLKKPAKYLLKGVADGVLVMRKGFPYVEIRKPEGPGFEDFFKKYEGMIKLEDLDPNDPFFAQYFEDETR